MDILKGEVLYNGGYILNEKLSDADTSKSFEFVKTIGTYNQIEDMPTEDEIFKQLKESEGTHVECYFNKTHEWYEINILKEV